MYLNGLATDILPLKEGNGISLLLNRHDEWGRSCFWLTLCYKRYRDTSVCVRRSAYVFHKDDFMIYGRKKNRPYKIKDSCKELQYVNDFSLFLSYTQILIHMQFVMFIFFRLNMYFLLSKEIGAGPLLKTKIANMLLLFITAMNLHLQFKILEGGTFSFQRVSEWTKTYNFVVFPVDKYCTYTYTYIYIYIYIYLYIL